MLLLLLVLASITASGEIVDPRFPSVSPDGSEMVFCWRGKLWQASVSGGTPRCLTPGEGRISHPAYSENGDWIAFTNDVTGSGDVYVMPSAGGVSTRLTYHGGEDRVLGWTGNEVLFSSSREGGDNWVWKISPDGGTPALELAALVKNLIVASGGYVIERGFTPWWRKHYAGSASSSLWAATADQCTPLAFLNKDQRWPLAGSDGCIFFVMEDETGQDRFYDTQGNPISPPIPGGITFPAISADGSVVVFESAGKLVRASFSDMVVEDIYLSARVDLPFPMEELSFAGVYTSDFAVANDASFMVMEAEGEIYAACITDGRLDDAVRITSTGALESHPRISADCSMILFQRELDGKVNIVLGAVEINDGDPIRIDLDELNTGREVSRSAEWASSGDFSFLDSDGCLYIMDILGGRSRKVCDLSGILHHSWSSDSRWIAFSTTVEAHREDIFIVSAHGGDPVNVSRHPNDDFQPFWPSDGRRLIWASRTDDGDYSIVQAWFDPEDWEAERDVRDELLDTPLDAVSAYTTDLYMRTEELCEVEGYYNFFGVTPDGRKIYFPSTDISGSMDLYSVDWDGENLTRESHGNYSPSRIQPTDTETAGAVYYLSYGSSLRNTDGDLLSWSAPYSLFRDEMQRQKFYSAWRQLRDSFYDSDMHGVNWNEMREKYQDRAAAALTNREFNDVVRRMLGELSASHLGIDGPWTYSRTAYTGETGIFPDHQWNGTGVRIDSLLPMSPGYLAGFLEGDIITQINCEPAGWNHNFYAPLRNTTDREIEFNFVRNGEPLRVRLTPVSQWELWNLEYDEWLSKQRRRVSQLSGHRVGYLHIPSMDQQSVKNFRRDLYAEGYGREAMIIDVRGNGGGSTHDQILASFAGESYAMSFSRSGTATVEPLGVWKNPVVLLINETCYSDAEIFPAAWKELNLGPIVGNTTYGAVIGTVDVELADGTGFRLPGTGWYTLAGDNLENNGVTPDILVLEMPEDMGLGVDRQLDAAIQTAMNLL
ncbi:MAG: PD40 domain-containing protein [Candidatus Sabulitectum sp.]|nr:PD40 domain-containing protein [Candidatus Sabulitectum sp.]